MAVVHCVGEEKNFATEDRAFTRLAIPEMPLEELSLNFARRLPASEESYDSITTVVCLAGVVRIGPARQTASTTDGLLSFSEKGKRTTSCVQSSC